MQPIHAATQTELFRISGERRPLAPSEIKRLDRYIAEGQTDPKKLARVIDMLRDDA